ncbi:MAG: beta-lactamase family protein [Lachnospiraceae bacterium]|nr:beta-lactamase family protein [Lachnospiraceae bacterium]
MTNFSIQKFPFPMHSICVWHKGQILQEEYFAPCSKDRKHRMFSITKAYTSLAIGALMAEGKLSLDDPIVKHFPEFVPENPHPWLTQMTIRDMLTMRTCHKSTTYKINEKENWVRSFFVTPPDHAPGKIFKYDTSSAHTMAALVKKMTDKGVLDYLRDVYLDRIGFSQDAFVLKDPFGSEIGGSGMVAYPNDLLVTAKLLLSLYKGTWENDYPDLAGCADSMYDNSFWKRYAAYIHEAMSYQTSTRHEAKTVDEAQGYGYQFWLLRDGGVMMYGMGGQYIAIYPDIDLIFITTADTQSIQGGTQYILDEMHRIAVELGVPVTAAAPSSATNEPDYNSVPITLRANGAGFRSFQLTKDALILEGAEHTFRIPYALDHYAECIDPKYHQTLFTKGFPQADGSMYLHTQILDDYVGAIHFVIQDNMLYMRKVEESLFKEFNGFFTGE